MTSRRHLILGVLAVAGLPLASWMTGTGGLAFTMFSGSGSFRLAAVAVGPDGRARPVPATALAARAGGSIGDVLAGSEQWRFSPYATLVRHRLDEVAALACAARPGSRTATVTLEARRTLDAPVVASSATASCHARQPAVGR